MLVHPLTISHRDTKQRYYMIPFMVMASMYNPLLCTPVWAKIGSIHLLAQILVERGFILKQKELYDLFKYPHNCPDVRWNGDKLEFLALLLHRLCNEKFIILKVSKAYFRFAERHFTDFDNNKMKENALRKLCYRVNNEKTRYAYVHAEIDEIIKKISL